MEKNKEIKLSLLILISIFIHLVILTGIFSPVNDEYFIYKGSRDKDSSGRDIIVNINQDNRNVLNKTTLLSDKNSSAKGFITRKKGDHWLNNSRDFVLKKGSKVIGRLPEKSMDQRDKTGILLTDNTEILIRLTKSELNKMFGQFGKGDQNKIPDRNSFSTQNSVFYSNNGTFSFNTKKFQPFGYFKKMKDKIASNWFPPLLANSIIAGFDPVTGSYTPGRLRIMAIPNQMVKLYFVMNRQGDVLEVAIVESMGNRPLDRSCLEAITNSKSFGKVPEEIEGDTIMIRFVFGYFVY